jgi:hypothetical protein
MNRFTFFYSLAIAAVMLPFTGSLVFADPLTLIEEGQPRAEIIIAEKPPRMVNLAAFELQRYLHKITKARLPIVHEPTDGTPVQIYVGRSEHTDKLGVNAEGLRYGAYRIASGENWLTLIGHDFDYTPPNPYPSKRSKELEDRARAEWDKITAEHTDAAWGFPYRTLYKSVWNKRDQLQVMFEGYGEDNSELWQKSDHTQTGGGFWMQDEGGSLNAVYDLLRSLGVRWFMPGEVGEVVPRMDTVSIDNLERDTTIRPDYPLRYSNWYNYSGFSWHDVIWGRRIGINSSYHVLGNLGYAHGHVFVHRRDTMKEAHPDFYALIGDKRDTSHRGYGTACYSSEGLEQETIKFARFLFDHYDEPHVSLWPTDGFKRCQCDKCAGQSPSDLVWGFVDRVGRALYKTHPDRLVSGGAYTSYVEPPGNVEKFTPNVGVFLSNRGRPRFMNDEHWETFTAQVNAWREKLHPGRLLRVENNRYSLWGPEDEPEPFPIFQAHAMAREMRALKGVSLGDCNEVSQRRTEWYHPALNHMNLYVLSRLYWDADQDVDALLDDYYEQFFGPVATEMKAAIEFAERAYTEAPIVAGVKATSATNVSLEDRLKLIDMLAKARDTAGDSVYRQRIAMMLDELPEPDNLRKTVARLAEMGDPRKDAPTISGRTTDWTKFVRSYALVDIETGKAVGTKTRFKVRWDDEGAVIFEIKCDEPDMENLYVTDDVWTGDSVAVQLETQGHAYYQIEVNPDGKIFDADRHGRLNQRWESNATVETERGDDSWSVVVRIPVVDAEEGAADPNHHVVGVKPGMDNPWYINVGRTRVRSSGKTTWSFPHTGKRSYHVPERFAKMVIE